MKVFTTRLSAFLFLVCISHSIFANHDHKSEIPKGSRATSELIDSSKVWVWDTISHTYTNIKYATFYTYDGQNNCILILAKNRLGGVFYNSAQTIFSYDANNNQTSEIAQYWSGSVWDTEYTITTIYDVNEKITSSMEIDFLGGTFDTTYKTYTYDANQNIVTYTHSERNLAIGNGNKDIYTYTNGDTSHPLSIVHQIWTNGQWVNYKMDLPIYVSTGFDTVYTQSWDVNNWYPYYRTINSPTEILTQDWINNAFWRDAGRELRTFDIYGNKTSDSSQTWNVNNSVWTLNSASLDTFNYDPNGNILTDKMEDLNTTTFLWTITQADTFTYDVSNNNLTRRELSFAAGDEYFNEYTDEYDAYNFISSEVQINFHNQTLSGNDSTHYYYHTYTTSGVHDLTAESDISIYPVPAHTLLTVMNLSSTPLIAAIYDVTGRELLNQKLDSIQSEINVSALPKGIYQVVFTDEDGGRTVKRLVVD